MFQPDNALFIDDKGFRGTIDTPVDSHPSIFIERDRLVGVAELVQPAQRIGPFVLVVQAIDGDLASAAEVAKVLKLGQSGRARGGRDIEV